MMTNAGLMEFNKTFCVGPTKGKKNQNTVHNKNGKIQIRKIGIPTDSILHLQKIGNEKRNEEEMKNN